MASYSQLLKSEEDDQTCSVLDLYYGSRDLRLLLDFFSISSGVAPALAILADIDQVACKEMRVESLWS